MFGLIFIRSVAARIFSPACFRGSLVGEETIAYLMGASLFTLDHYNDRLLMLKMGALDLDTFVGMLCQ